MTDKNKLYKINPIRKDLETLENKLDLLSIIYDDKVNENSLITTDYNDFNNIIKRIVDDHGNKQIEIHTGNGIYFIDLKSIFNYKEWLLSYYLIKNILHLSSNSNRICMYIDRDGTYLTYILKFLTRDDIILDIKKMSLFDKMNLLEEARFYELDSFSSLILDNLILPKEEIKFESLSIINKFVLNKISYENLNSLYDGNDHTGIGINQNATFTIIFKKKYLISKLIMKGLSVIPQTDNVLNSSQNPYFYFDNDENNKFDLNYTYKDNGFEIDFNNRKPINASKITFRSFVFTL